MPAGALAPCLDDDLAGALGDAAAEGGPQSLEARVAHLVAAAPFTPPARERAKLDAWLSHNVVEVGTVSLFLPTRYPSIGAAAATGERR